VIEDLKTGVSMDQEAVKYEVGDEIEYESLGGRRIVRVTGKFSDIKNGEPGFDCVGNCGE
jgi:hypothetical protein